jgi:hypothetical protein
LSPSSAEWYIAFFNFEAISTDLDGITEWVSMSGCVHFDGWIQGAGELFQISRLASVPVAPFAVFAAVWDGITCGFVMQTCSRAVDFVIGDDIKSNMIVVVVANGLTTIPGLVASLVGQVDAVVKPVHLNWATCQIACAPWTCGIIVLIIRTIIESVCSHAAGFWAAFGHLTVGNVIAETLVNVVIAPAAVCILVDAIGSLVNLFRASWV